MELNLSQVEEAVAYIDKLEDRLLVLRCNLGKLEAALELAKEAKDAGEVPVGCVIARNGEIVGRGRNRRETGKTALGHAEIEAISDACRNLGGWRLWECTLYVTLEPCPMCAGAIINARIPRVVYGASDKKFGAVINKFTHSIYFVLKITGSM